MTGPARLCLPAGMPGVRWSALLAAAAGLLLLDTARADGWRLDGAASSRAEVTDNFGLAVRPASARIVAINGELQASRETEAERTRATLTLEERRTSGGRSGASDARLQFGHRYTTRTGSVDAAFDASLNGQSSTPATPEAALLGPNERQGRSLSVLWAEEWGERWSTNARGGYEEVSFSGRAASGDFRSTSVSLTLNRSLDEQSSAGVTLALTDFALDSALSGTRTVSVNIGGNRALDERSSLSAFFGVYRSERRVELGFEACPLPVSFCLAGLVPTVPVNVTERRGDTGLQYDVSWRWRSDESTSVALSAAQQLQPGVLGVQRSQNLRARLDRRLAPRWTGSVEIADARSTAPGGVASPELQGLDLALGWDAAPDWSIGLTGALRLLRDPVSATQAQSKTAALTVRHQAPRLWSDR